MRWFLRVLRNALIWGTIIGSLAAYLGISPWQVMILVLVAGVLDSLLDNLLPVEPDA